MDRVSQIVLQAEMDVKQVISSDGSIRLGPLCIPDSPGLGTSFMMLRCLAKLGQLYPPDYWGTEIGQCHYVYQLAVASLFYKKGFDPNANVWQMPAPGKGEKRDHALCQKQIKLETELWLALWAMLSNYYDNQKTEAISKFLGVIRESQLVMMPFISERIYCLRHQLNKLPGSTSIRREFQAQNRFLQTLPGQPAAVSPFSPEYICTSELIKVVANHAGGLDDFRARYYYPFVKARMALVQHCMLTELEVFGLNSPAEKRGRKRVKKNGKPEKLTG